MSEPTEPERLRAEAVDAEQARWQERIYCFCQRISPKANIDGAGSDSGDPLDFTMAELHQACNHWENRAFHALEKADISIPPESTALETIFAALSTAAATADKLREELSDANRKIRALNQTIDALNEAAIDDLT